MCKDIAIAVSQFLSLGDLILIRGSSKAIHSIVATHCVHLLLSKSTVQSRSQECACRHITAALLPLTAPGCFRHWRHYVSCAGGEDRLLTELLACLAATQIRVVPEEWSSVTARSDRFYDVMRSAPSATSTEPSAANSFNPFSGSSVCGSRTTTHEIARWQPLKSSEEKRDALELWEACALRHRTPRAVVLAQVGISPRTVFEELCGNTYVQGEAQVSKMLSKGGQYVVFSNERDFSTVVSSPGACNELSARYAAVVLCFVPSTNAIIPIGRFRGMICVVATLPHEVLQEEVESYLPLGAEDEEETASGQPHSQGLSAPNHAWALADSCAIRSVDLRGADKLRSLGERFLSECECLTSIDLSGLADLTALPDGFASECAALETTDLRGLRSVTQIGDEVLSHCVTLRSIDLTSMTSLRTIGNSFLCGCSSLVDLCVDGLQALKEVDDSFMKGCESLRVVDLHGLAAVEKIGDGFLSDCVTLRRADLSALTRVRHIGSSFLSGCTALEEASLNTMHDLESIGDSCLSDGCALLNVEVCGLRRLDSIGAGFLGASAAMKTLRLMDLPSLRRIGSSFASGCPALEEVTLLRLSNLESIADCFLCNSLTLHTVDFEGSTLRTAGDGFLCDCPSLKNLIGISALMHMTEVGDGLLSGCSDIETIDTGPMRYLEACPRSFLSRCKALRSVDLSNFGNVQSIEDSFLARCDALTCVDLSAMISVCRIGDSFLGGCKALRTVTVRDLPKLQSFGNCCFSGCTALTTLIVAHLPMLQTIGYHFGSGCVSLTTVRVSDLPELQTIGESFFARCQELRALNMSKLPRLRSVGQDFLSGCSSLEFLDARGGPTASSPRSPTLTPAVHRPPTSQAPMNCASTQHSRMQTFADMLWYLVQSNKRLDLQTDLIRL